MLNKHFNIQLATERKCTIVHRRNLTAKRCTLPRSLHYPILQFTIWWQHHALSDVGNVAILVALNARIYKYFIWEQHTTNMPGNWYEYWYWRTYQLGYDMKQYQALFRYHNLVWETEVIPCIYTCLYSSINTRFIPAIYEAKKISLGPNTKYQSRIKDFQRYPLSTCVEYSNFVIEKDLFNLSVFDTTIYTSFQAFTLMKICHHLCHQMEVQSTSTVVPHKHRNEED